MEKISNETALTLLEDPDPRSYLAVMQIMLDRDDVDAFVAEHQDEENPRLRKRIQQLHNVVRIRRLQQQFVAGLDDKTLSFWDALKRLSLIFDQRYSESALELNLEAFMETARMQHPSSEALANFMRKKNFIPPAYQHMFEIETFFLPEALTSGNGQTLLLCALCRQICKRSGWGGTIVIYSGKFMFQTPDGVVLMPDEDWTVLKNRDVQRYHVCTEQELVHSYLAQIFAACVIDNQPYDLCVFARMMVSHCGAKLEEIPFPLGMLRQRGGKFGV